MMYSVHEDIGLIVKAKDEASYGIVASYLGSDLQAPAICDAELEWINRYEQTKSTRNVEYGEFVASGNLIRRLLTNDDMHLMTIFDDPNFTTTTVVPIVEAKRLIYEWKDVLRRYFESKA